MNEIHEQATEYRLSYLPLDHRETVHLSITVEWRGQGRWAICHNSKCLNANGEWDYEMCPSERVDDWLNAHRFDLDTALQLAREHLSDLEVNGWTAEDVLRRKL